MLFLTRNVITAMAHGCLSAPRGSFIVTISLRERTAIHHWAVAEGATTRNRSGKRAANLEFSGERWRCHPPKGQARLCPRNLSGIKDRGVSRSIGSPFFV